MCNRSPSALTKGIVQMAIFNLSPESIKTLKTRLTSALPKVSSSHLYEAISSGLGFNTYAALKSAQDKENTHDFNQVLFTQRLTELGYGPMFESYTDLENKKKLNKTTQTWQKLMVYGLNEAIIQGKFDLALCVDHKSKIYNFFEFKLSNGVTVNAGIRDDGFQEMILSLAINPEGTFYSCANPSLRQNDAWAKGWLERKEGLWLEVSESGKQLFQSKRKTMQMLQEVKPCLPLGYNQRGKFML